MAGGEEGAVLEDDGADGDFAEGLGLVGFRQGELHGLLIGECGHRPTVPIQLRKVWMMGPSMRGPPWAWKVLALRAQVIQSRSLGRI